MYALKCNREVPKDTEYTIWKGYVFVTENLKAITCNLLSIFAKLHGSC